MKDQFGELIDYELADVADAVFTNLTLNKASKGQIPHIQPRTINFPLSRFWLRVTDSSGNIIYATKLAKLADIFPARGNHSYIVMRDIAHEQIWLPPPEREEITGDSVKLQARFFTRTVEGQQYFVHIAKPLLLFNAEFNE